MSYLRYAARIYNVPLLITSDKARVLEQIIRAHEEGRASLLSPAAPSAPRNELSIPGAARADGGYTRIDKGASKGVAIIQAVGTLVQRSADEKLDALSGLVAYGTLSAQVQAAADDPMVDAILLEVDSQGGEGAGIVDAAGKIRAAAAKKPVWAIANEQAFSAGYWIASAATKLFVPSTGMVGSIGVRTLHVDQSQRDAKQGLVYTEIASHARKTDFSTHAPLSDPAKAFAQQSVDDLAGMFVAAVADQRGIDPQTVDDLEAAILSPQAALAAGLIDGIQSFDETLAQLAAEAQHVRIHGMRAAGTTRAQGGYVLPELNQEIGATMANEQTFTAAQLADAETRAAAKAKTEAEVDAAKKLADAQMSAGKLAQDRVGAILTHAEASGRKGLSEYLAFKTSTSVEDAVAILAASPKEGAAAPAKSEFAAEMERQGNARIVPDAAATGRSPSGDPSKPAVWTNAQIFAFRKECVQKARAR